MPSELPGQTFRRRSRQIEMSTRLPSGALFPNTPAFKYGLRSDWQLLIFGSLVTIFSNASPRPWAAHVERKGE